MNSKLSPYKSIRVWRKVSLQVTSSKTDALKQYNLFSILLWQMHCTWIRRVIVWQQNAALKHTIFFLTSFFLHSKPCFHQSYRITTSISCCLIILKKQKQKKNMIKRMDNLQGQFPCFWFNWSGFRQWLFSLKCILAGPFVTRTHSTFTWIYSLFYLVTSAAYRWKPVSFLHIKKFCLPIYFISCSYMNIDMRSAHECNCRS